MRITVEKSSTVMNSLNEQRMTGQFCDVKLLSADGVEFSAHKNCLAAGSEYFANMLNSGLEESKAEIIKMEGFDGETLEIVLAYIYAGIIDINFKNASTVINAFNLMLLNNVVVEIDARLSSEATKHTKEVLEIAKGPVGLPKSRKRVAQEICVMEDKKKRSQFVENVDFAIMLEIVKSGDTKCNDFFQDILLWLKTHGKESDILLICESLDFSVVRTSNLGNLVDFLMIVMKDKMNFARVLKKTVELLIASRSGTLRHTVENVSKFSGLVFSEIQTVGSLRWKLSITGEGKKKVRDGRNVYDSLGVYLWCLPEDNTHIETWKCLVTCSFKLLSTGVSTKELVLESISYPREGSEGFGFKKFASWESLFDRENDFVTDDSITIEAHLVLESIVTEWK